MYSLPPGEGSIFCFCKLECSFMVEGAKSYQYSLDLTFSGCRQEFIALDQGLTIHIFVFHGPISILVPLSGKTTSRPSLCFLKHDCRVGVSSVVASSSGVWLPVWVLEASVWPLASHAAFISTSVPAANPSQEVRNFLSLFGGHLPDCFWWHS